MFKIRSKDGVIFDGQARKIEMCCAGAKCRPFQAVGNSGKYFRGVRLLFEELESIRPKDLEHLLQAKDITEDFAVADVGNMKVMN